jgi:hypothetical protein
MLMSRDTLATKVEKRVEKVAAQEGRRDSAPWCTRRGTRHNPAAPRPVAGNAS